MRLVDHLPVRLGGELGLIGGVQQVRGRGEEGDDGGVVKEEICE
jgi:hypothetical protein